MQIKQTGLQKEQSQFPSQLEFLEVINNRGDNYFLKEKKLYQSLKTGFDGQKKVLTYLKKYGSPSWTILENVWLDYFGTFENDLILITNHAVYILEIKNYSGTFTYEEGKCFYNQIESSINPFEQVRSCKVNVQNILSKKLPNLTVKCAVIFAGDDNEVQMNSTIEGVVSISRTQILNFIQRIIEDEKNNRRYKIDTTQLLHTLAPYEIPTPYAPLPLTKEDLSHIVGGIYCAHCLSYDVKTTKFWVTCSCGLEESRDEAIIRTICDYGVLTYDRNLTRKELENFLTPKHSVTLLKRILYKHFQVNKNYGRTNYTNKKRLYSGIQDQFTIEHPRILNSSDQQMIFSK